ncbi:FAD binding domain-containing protein [Streptomyces sp. NPDC021093]|uniref:FAD binding domain-containing protein n=1 Tax=Streptomyces sp. NPDC021093 TaxID=3365112 RepID=UPI00378BDD1B
MEYLLPRDREDALRALADRPGAVPVAGGTEVMMRLNAGDEPPAALLDLSRLAGLAAWSPVGEDTEAAEAVGEGAEAEDGTGAGAAGGRRLDDARAAGRPLRLGATLTYTRLVRELSGPLPGLAEAAAAVGSRQIRNRGTLGGALGSAWPAGDLHPMLLACRADVVLESVRGRRRVPARALYTGPGSTVREPDELFTAIEVPRAAGPQCFTALGRRSSLTISTASFAVALWPDLGRVGTGMGGVAGTPRAATAAEEFVAAELTRLGAWESAAPLPDELLRHFGELAAGESAPVDDVRGSASYRRHALAVLARRTLARAWQQRHPCRMEREPCA